MKQPLISTVFQAGYVVSDIEKAAAMFADKFGVTNFQIQRDMPLNNEEGQTIHFGMTYAGDTLVELIQQTDNSPSIYEGLVDPNNDNEVRMHHYALLLPDEVDFEDFLSGLRKQGTDIPIDWDNGAARAVLVDFRKELGHCLEYIQLGPEGRKWLETIPKN